MNYAEIVDNLSELNPDAVLASGLTHACIGYTLNHHHAHVAVYDYEACIALLMVRDGMTEEEADECLSFNTLDAYLGENGPIFIKIFVRIPNDTQA